MRALETSVESDAWPTVATPRVSRTRRFRRRRVIIGDHGGTRVDGFRRLRKFRFRRARVFPNQGAVLTHHRGHCTSRGNRVSETQRKARQVQRQPNWRRGGVRIPGSEGNGPWFA